jgi:uncharacterized protein YbaR (Trm112 family)
MKPFLRIGVASQNRQNITLQSKQMLLCRALKYAHTVLGSWPVLPCRAQKYAYTVLRSWPVLPCREQKYAYIVLRSWPVLPCRAPKFAYTILRGWPVLLCRTPKYATQYYGVDQYSSVEHQNMHTHYSRVYQYTHVCRVLKYEYTVLKSWTVLHCTAPKFAQKNSSPELTSTLLYCRALKYEQNTNQKWSPAGQQHTF